MSKAFTSDSDGEGESPEAPALPPGTRNYMTRAGAERLRGEMERLTAERRALAQDVEGKARAQVIERRLRYLAPRVEALEIIDPSAQPKDRVLFGATVTVSEAPGKTEIWRIVGLDEIDLERGWISWMSPLANALLEKRVGDVAPFMGRKLMLVQISYDAEVR